MEIIIYVLDDPWSKYDWSKTTEIVNTLEDLEKITGHCHKRMYCCVHSFSGNESEQLLQAVNDYYIKTYNSDLTKTIDWMFKLISRGIKNESLNRRPT